MATEKSADSTNDQTKNEITSHDGKTPQPAGKNPPAVDGAAPQTFEEFTLDDIDVIESKVFA